MNLWDVSISSYRIYSTTSFSVVFLRPEGQLWRNNDLMKKMPCIIENTEKSGWKRDLPLGDRPGARGFKASCHNWIPNRTSLITDFFLNQYKRARVNHSWGNSTSTQLHSFPTEPLFLGGTVVPTHWPGAHSKTPSRCPKAQTELSPVYPMLSLTCTYLWHSLIHELSEGLITNNETEQL